MKLGTYLADTSALFRLLTSPHRAQWEPELTAGIICTCPVVELEFLYSARSLADRLAKQRLLRDVFSWVSTPDRVWQRAEEVQQALTERGAHRSAGAVDLLIAATAEAERLTVITDDRDFEQIAAVTGQPVRLLRPTE